MTTQLSVVLATYNGADFVGEQLETIAAQTRPPDELRTSGEGIDTQGASVVPEGVGVSSQEPHTARK